MTLNGTRDKFTRKDLLQLGGVFGIRRDGKDVIDEVVEGMSSWENYAKQAKVPAARIEAIRERFRLL
jgi:serine/threonine-protein kinase HipA